MSEVPGYKPVKSIKVQDLRDRRYEGFVNTAGIHESKGKLFYLIERSSGGDAFDWVVSIGSDAKADPIWNEKLQAFVNPEVFGLIPNIGDKFAGAYPMSREMALHYIDTCTNAILVPVSVDEALGIKPE